MVQNTGIRVPDNSIQCGENITIPMIAEGAITPGQLVKKGTADNQVLVATPGDKGIIGVADLNRNALAKSGGLLTAAYAAGDPLEVIVIGFVKVLADTGGITAGSKVQVGASNNGRVRNYTDTAAPVAYVQADLEAIKDELGLVIGRAYTSAAAGSYAVIWLDPA
jgi:hypothetical protein